MHIRPWEIDLLTVEQMDRAVLNIDRQIAENQKGGDDGQ